MTAAPFSRLPDTARLWIFASPEPLSDPKAERLLEVVDTHLASWLAHGRPVVGARDWRYDRFLLVAADEAATGVSGCSIDSLFHVLQREEQRLGIRLLDPAPVWFRDAAGELRSATRSEFRAHVRNGSLGPDTVVFDNTVATVGDVREARWETRMKDAWHQRAFGAARAS